MSKTETAPKADDGLLSELDIPPAPKTEETKKDAPSASEAPKAPEGVKPPEAVKPAKPETEDEKRIRESREALKHPLAPNQKFFEAPDGFVVAGESDRDHMPERRPNKPWKNLNPRR